MSLVVETVGYYLLLPSAVRGGGATPTHGAQLSRCIPCTAHHRDRGTVRALQVRGLVQAKQYEAARHTRCPPPPPVRSARSAPRKPLHRVRARRYEVISAESEYAELAMKAAIAATQYRLFDTVDGSSEPTACV